MRFLTLTIAAGMLYSCSVSPESKEGSTTVEKDYITRRLEAYAPFELTANVNQLSATDKQIVPLLIDAAKIMDTLFWLQASGRPDSIIALGTTEEAKRFISINYGPWDRLNNDTPFISGVASKPPTANFYPHDLTKEALEKSDVKDKEGQYSLIRRDAAGKLYSIPYHIAFKPYLERAAALLNKAAGITTEASFKKYLTLRAKALLDDNYTASDIAWMDMKDNSLDVIIGPIENYEDKLLGKRTSYESYVLVKDKEWSKRLEKYVTMLPALQKGLPVEQKYKAEVPGSSSQLGAYDIVYYAGDCNAGSKTIAVNLPNDEELQKTKGTRRSQLKNAMRAKFDKILLPIAEEFIDESQVKQVNFDAFFANVMFHEVAHGLGIKNTVDGKGTVRNALQEQSSWLEEAKADILGLYMVSKLVEQKELQGPIENYYTTFMAGILRSVRFGAASAHGKANMLAFNYFQEKGAFEKTSEGRYKVNFQKFKEAMDGLSNLVLTMQGNGDKAAVVKLQQTHGIVKDDLKADLNKLQEKGVPVDIVFKQGKEVLGL